MRSVSRRRDDQSYELARRIQRAFGVRLQTARARKGSLQKVLAGHLNLSRTSISNIERGTHRVFLDQVYAAAYALGVEVTDLVPTVAEIYASERVHTASDNPLPEKVAREADHVAKTIQLEYSISGQRRRSIGGGKKS